MSSGATHLFTNLIVSTSLNLIAVNSNVSPEICSGVIVGGFIGTIITPDADLKKTLPKRITSVIPLWNWLWTPYTKAFKHRSIWSHSPILSTAIRAAYLSILLLPLFLLLYFFNIYTLSPTFLIYVFGVWCIQDISHLFLDGILFK